MRGPLPVLVLLAALGGGAALPGCSGTTTCTANADCPAQSYCVPGDGGTKGACRRDCEATLDCRDPALRCDSLGRCVPVEIPGVDAGLDAAADAAAPDDAVTPDDGAGDAPLDDAGSTD